MDSIVVCIVCLCILFRFGKETNPYQNGNERILTGVYFTGDLCHALARSILCDVFCACDILKTGY